MYKPKDQTNQVATHEDGAIEIRASFLTVVDDQPRRIDVHVLDAEAVIETLEKRGARDLATTLQHLLDLGKAAAEKHPDAHLLEITPEFVAELVPAQKKKSAKRKPKKSAAS